MADSVSAASLLREARRRAGLSQAELARRAGITQSVVSAYETSSREPSLPTLSKLVRASGGHLDIKVRVPRGLGRLSGPLGRRVRTHRNELVAAAARHGASNLRIFGSVARGEDQSDSDVDLLVDLPEGVGLFALGRLRKELEQILGTKVDLIPAGDLKPTVRRDVEAEQVPL